VVMATIRPTKTLVEVVAVEHPQSVGTATHLLVETAVLEQIGSYLELHMLAAVAVAFVVLVPVVLAGLAAVAMEHLVLLQHLLELQTQEAVAEAAGT
jgi:hypothetical protein